MLHWLRGGAMNFIEITAVVPWLEMAYVMNIEPTRPQPAEPKVFKTHLRHDQIPKGGRYVHMTRAPEDALVSMYHFHEGWFFEPGSISLEAYALELFLAGGRAGNYWQFQASWWPRRSDRDVLYLTYEHALADPRRTIERLATFVNIELDEALLALTEERSTFSYMKCREHQFDDNLWRAATDAMCRLPADSTSTKVRTGEAGKGRAHISEAVRDALEREWVREIGDRFGLESYSMLCDVVLSETT